jgi:GDP-L-fucose synthase
MEKEAKIYIAGHSGLIGTALLSRLKAQGYVNLLVRPHAELDLLRQTDAEDFFKKEKPDYVIIAAARVGGIQANISRPAQFIYENLMIQNNIIHAAYKYGVKKLLFFGSACTYPYRSPQPMKEEYLLTGKPEPTNEQYAVAKIAGTKMCQAYNKQYGTNFITVVPTNTYGPNDNFDPEDSHVIPAMIMRFQRAKMNKHGSVTIWGSGKPRREFIFADDVADACLFLMRVYNDSEIINVSTGEDISIKDLALLVKAAVGYDGKIVFDKTKPDGIARKTLDVSRLRKLGWQAKTGLAEGIEKTYRWHLEHIGNKR